ncbi:hypothetical protein CEXT_562731 [Caerostris extrusa]|uniref:Uncharacterized protein n=1 Tax=Caerostris extrusa TaxID=172846 RepID=A0AAV4WPA0_CAEEX|nr:hypothetical protein CEXT_562731 [Caerostris extrusa]
MAVDEIKSYYSALLSVGSSVTSCELCDLSFPSRSFVQNSVANSAVAPAFLINSGRSTWNREKKALLFGEISFV